MGSLPERHAWQQGYPVMLSIEGRQAVVIGGGRVASRKIRSLLQAGAHVRVVSPRLDPVIDVSQIEWVRRGYERRDLDGAYIVIACTDNRALNDRISNETSDMQLVNDVSNPARSDFMNVAVIAQSDVLIGISTYGHSPRKASVIKKRILQWLRAQPWWGSTQ